MKLLGICLGSDNQVVPCHVGWYVDYRARLYFFLRDRNHLIKQIVGKLGTIQATFFSKIEFDLYPKKANYVTHLLPKEVDFQPNVLVARTLVYIVSTLIDNLSVI
jgi:hypothetical protein